MSGKSYTMREMKAIVDHLVETKAYSEIKGRKMWVDFANTKLTNRTWQSLKETFLKRILPDIHNPYYKLSVEQINSFRAGYDVKDKNKLEVQEVHTLSDSSNSNGGNNKNDNKESNINSNEAENTAGENIKCSKIPSRNRSSADTVIVDNCYENAEAIQNVLESPKVTNNDKSKDSTSKSLRDCITYSEPLTPMLQEVLDDFASEPEYEDNPLQIVENNVNEENENSEQAESNKGSSEAPVIEGNTEETVGNVSTEVHPKQSEEQIIDTNTVEEDESIEKICTEEQTEESEVQIINKPKENGISKLQDSTNYFSAENGEPNTNAIITQDEINSQSIIPLSKEVNSSNSTADASLPNNPEALNNQNKNVEENKDGQATSQTSSFIPSRKRANSEEQSTEIKKKKLDRLKLKPQIQNNEENTPIVNDKSPKADTKNPKMSKKSPKLDTNKGITEKVEEVQSNNDIIGAPENSIIQPVDKSSETAQSAETSNPCLQNVSLFDQKLNSLKYDSSDSSDKPKQIEVKPQNKETVITKEVVVLRSHTDSDTEEIPTLPLKNRKASSKDRDRILANVFGFTSGAVGPRRKRQLSRRRRTISHNNISRNHAESDSSQWTSESDSDMYVSPPRGRKNRTSKKYLRPKSAKIMSLEEEGGLFVMYGKKIYPLVKDGKIVKNYLTYLPDSASENEDDYWKSKYEEEKKRTDELKKLLEKSRQPGSPRDASPILPNPSRASRSSHKQKIEPNTNGKEICKEEKKQEALATVVPAEKIKIKFTKNNEEVHLEGHWPQIHPVLEQVVQIFHKESETAMEEAKAKSLLGPEQSKESSRSTTPIVIPVIADVEVHQKVDKIEDEIFKEIEERDKEEQKIPSEAESNVTKRRGRPRISTSVPASPAKRQKTKQPEEKENQEASTSKSSPKVSENKIVTRASRKSAKSPKRTSNEPVNNSEQRTIQTRRSKGNVTAKKTSEVTEQNDVRYKLPSKTNTLSPRRNTRNKPQKSTPKSPQIYLSPENIANSLDSTQGYQDSDVSPVNVERKKKRMSLSTVMNRGRRSSKRIYPYMHCDASNDSSNSSPPVKVSRDSTLNTEVYRTDSYQMLMPQRRLSARPLDPIEETKPISEFEFYNDFHSESDKNGLSLQIDLCNNLNSGPSTSDMGSSSISLPLSPELSVVENLSISRDVLDQVDDFPTINETQGNEVYRPIAACSQYMISDVDVSIPLMQQECELDRCVIVNNSCGPKTLVTESLIGKIGTFNLEDQVTATDTLDEKLRDLLLESAKKLAMSTTNTMMEVDESKTQQKKAASKKRCSTPRRKKTSKHLLVPNVDPVIEEEHVEYSAQGGRRSCPPVIETFDAVSEEIDISSLTIDKPKGRKKKDVIKVKILRPKNKKSKESSEPSRSASRLSTLTDSGIIDNEVFLHDSVDLIHNHSETCLFANECVGDSIELVETAEKSVISVGDSMNDDNMMSSQNKYHDAQDVLQDVFCNNVVNVRHFRTVSTEDRVDSTSDTVYHSPVCTANTSLITEDLSDDIPLPQELPTKWYLLSEDENTNSNVELNRNLPKNVASYGADLNKIFPITCAIPDLSTITEMSREADDNSRKPTLTTEILEGLSGEDMNSQNIF